MKILFVAQMGTNEQQQQLVSEILGYPIEMAHKYFSMSKHRISCVYFCIVGWVGDLRDAMKIPAKFKNEQLLCKFGETSDGKDRMCKHKNSLGKIKGAQLSLKFHTIMNKSNLIVAEKEIKDYFKILNCYFKYEHYTELVIIDEEELEKIEVLYSDLYNTYGTGEDKNKIKVLEDEKKELETKILLLEKEMKLQIQ